MTATPTELRAMARARELGEGVLGSTSPNPAVGAVVLDARGDVVGDQHPRAHRAAASTCLRRACTAAAGSAAP